MADITACTTKDCPSESHCYRKTAVMSEYQWMSEFKFTMVNGVFKCENYWNKDER